MERVAGSHSRALAVARGTAVLGVTTVMLVPSIIAAAKQDGLRTTAMASTGPSRPSTASVSATPTAERSIGARSRASSGSTGSIPYIPQVSTALNGSSSGSYTGGISTGRTGLTAPGSMRSIAFTGIGVGGNSAGSGANTLFGATIYNAPDLAMKTREFGHMPIVHIYYTGLPPASAWSTNFVMANHSAVIVSFNAMPNAILSGSDNANLKHFFDTAPVGHPIYYSYFHEPEDNIAAGQFTAAAYRAAWAHVVNLADAAHNPDLHSTLILMAWDLIPYAHRNWRNYLPAGHIISALGWDAYPVGGYGVAAPNTWMGAAVETSKAAGLPFGIAEFGTATVKGRPAWLTSVGQYARDNGALFCTLYDSTIHGGMLRHGGTYFVSDSASIAAWRKVVTTT